MTRCIVCQCTDTRPIYSGVLRCRECGYAFAQLELTDQQFFAIYGKNYFLGEEYSNYLTDREVLQKNFKLRWNVLRKFLDPGRHQFLLEIGCAYGFFLDLVRDRFKAAVGIDVSEDGIRYAQEELKLDAVYEDFLKYDLGSREVDVACMWDTIEHLRAPDLYLEKLGKHMKSGALLALTTGDIESLNARIKKDKWRLLHPPSHAHYFSRRTIRMLLDKYGFDVIYNKYAGFYRSIDNIAYGIFVLRKQKPQLYDLLRKTRLTKLNVYLNLYDIMFVIARKR